MGHPTAARSSRNDPFARPRGGLRDRAGPASFSGRGVASGPGRVARRLKAGPCGRSGARRPSWWRLAPNTLQGWAELLARFRGWNKTSDSLHAKLAWVGSVPDGRARACLVEGVVRGSGQATSLAWVSGGALRPRGCGQLLSV